MRVLYAGDTICDFKTLQRLILIAQEIAFMDRPAIMYGDWGMVGHDSQLRRMDTSNSTVPLTVHPSPTGPVNEMFKAYIDADLRSITFIRTFLDGLANNKRFQSRFISAKSDYGSGTGQDVLDALNKDSSLVDANLTEPIDGTQLFQIDTAHGRRETLKSLIVEASVHVTNALLVSEGNELTPVTDDPYLCRLISLRVGHPQYVHQQSKLSPYLGLAIASSVIPDEALSKLEIEDLFEFRKSSKDAYAHWHMEIDRLAVRLIDMDPERAEKEIPKIIDGDIRPRLIEYQNEMKYVRDKLFGDLIKKVARWEMPTVSLAYLANLDVVSALALFAGALAPSVPALVDYFVKRREIRRRNSMAYLIGLSEALEK